MPCMALRRRDDDAAAPCLALENSNRAATSRIGRARLSCQRAVKLRGDIQRREETPRVIVRVISPAEQSRGDTAMAAAALAAEH